MSLDTTFGSLRRSHNAEGEEELPGKRQPLPMMAMGSSWGVIVGGGVLDKRERERGRDRMGRMLNG